MSDIETSLRLAFPDAKEIKRVERTSKQHRFVRLPTAFSDSAPIEELQTPKPIETIVEMKRFYCNEGRCLVAEYGGVVYYSE